MLQVIPVPALKDNYIWCLRHNNQCVVVDPGDAAPIIELLTQQSLQLAAIVLTHHHYDHTQGVDELLHFHTAPVYGPSTIQQVSQPLTSDQLTIAAIDKTFRIISVPGHTLEHVAYYTPGLVFTGDTLFTAGCGRIFEGTADQMYHSLRQLASLPDETQIYCGHEYTEANLRFALEVEPHSQDILQRMQTTKQLRQENRPTVPASLLLEKKTNPFLRLNEPEVILAVSRKMNAEITTPVEVLKILREWKNSFH